MMFIHFHSSRNHHLRFRDDPFLTGRKLPEVQQAAGLKPMLQIYFWGDEELKTPISTFHRSGLLRVRRMFGARPRLLAVSSVASVPIPSDHLCQRKGVSKPCRTPDTGSTTRIENTNYFHVKPVIPGQLGPDILNK